MGIVNEAKIPDDQYNLLVDVINSLRHYRGDQIINLIDNIAQSTVVNNDIIVTNGVHFSQFDQYGPFHFNIKIRNRGMVSSIIYHVYVTPVLYAVENQGFFIDPDGTVTASCSKYWAYQYKSLT